MTELESCVDEQLRDLTRERDEARRLNDAHAASALEYMRIADEARAERDETQVRLAAMTQHRDDLASLLFQATGDSEIDGRAMRTLLGLADGASAQDIVDALMGMVAEASLWRGMMGNP